MGKKLYIHAGLHKTATSSIQLALLQEKELLEKHGITFFRQYPNGKKAIGSFSTYGWFSFFPESIKKGCLIKNKTRLVKYLSELKGDVVFSSEHLSFVFDEIEIKSFKELLNKHFDDFEIIFYLRRQDQQIISLKNQGNKNFKWASNIFTGNEIEALPRKTHFKQYLDYNDKLNMWAKYFGQSKITIRIFEDQSLYKNDPVTDFFRILGIETNSTYEKENASYGFEKSKIACLLNNAGISNNVLRSNILKNIKTKRKWLPDEVQAKSFYNEYCDSNQALNEKFQINNKNTLFDESFNQYPLNNEENWSEEEINATLLTIFKNLDNTYGKLDLNHLYIAAIRLEEIDIKLSFNLMLTIHIILPSKKTHSKLIEYNSRLQNIL